MKRTERFIVIGVVVAALMAGITSCTLLTDLSLSASEVELAVGDSAEVTVTATNLFGMADTISASSSDETVAAVTVNGLKITITAEGPGSASITVTSGSGIEAVCEVTVLETTPEIEGTWIYLGGDYSTRLEIYDGFIRFYSGIEAEIETTDALYQECEIIKVNNTELNGGDPESTDCGYLVLKYTTPSSWLADSQNKFGIFRWAGFNGTDVMWFSEGWIDLDGDFSGDHFDTPAEAIEGMTVDTFAFSAYPTFYSEAARLAS